MKRLFLIGIFWASPALAAPVNWSTSTVPDAWRFQLSERLGISQSNAAYINGVKTALGDQAFWEADSHLGLELGLGNGVGFTAMVPYAYRGVWDGRQGGGAQDYLLGFSKQVAARDGLTCKSQVQVGLAGAYGVGSGVGMEHTLKGVLVPEALAWLGYLGYYYPLIDGTRFNGDQIRWGVGTEWYPVSGLELSLELYGRYAGLAKMDGAPTVVDGHTLSGQGIALAPGVAFKQGGLTLFAGMNLPVARLGTLGASPAWGGTVGTIWEF